MNNHHFDTVGNFIISGLKSRREFYKALTECKDKELRQTIITEFIEKDRNGGLSLEDFEIFTKRLRYATESSEI